MAQRLSDLTENQALKIDLQKAEQRAIAGDKSAAFSAYRTALKTAESAEGVNSPAVGDICCILSGLYEETKNNPKKAAELLARAYKISVTELGSTAVETGKILYNLGRLYKILGNDKRAAGAFIRALEIVERDLGGESAIVASILNNMGDIYENNGEQAKAREYYIKARQIFDAALQADPVELALLNEKLKNMGVDTDSADL